MARATVANERGGALEPLYHIHPITGATIEVFFADFVLAGSFGKASGWFWWSCKPGSLPECQPTGPFPTGYAAYRDAMNGGKRLFVNEPFCRQ